MHDGKEYFAEVGQIENRIGEEAIVILDSDTYLVRTPNRGVIIGGPILAGKNEIKGIEFFD